MERNVDWWSNLNTQEQQGYLKEHPHSHKKSTIQIDSKYLKNVSKVAHHLPHDDLEHNLYEHLDDEDLKTLDDVVNGKTTFEKSKSVLKKCLMVAIAGSILGVGLALSAKAVLGVYAAMRVLGNDPAHWLYTTIYNVGKSHSGAVKDALHDFFPALEDHKLDTHLEGIEEV